MLPNSPCFIFYLETIEDSFIDGEQLNKLSKEYSTDNIYFFTHKCDISIKSISEYLKNNNIKFKQKNIVTPTFLLMSYCKNLVNDLSVYPITNTNDLWDFHEQNIKIDYENPKIMCICTNEISKKDLQIIYNTDIPIALSSNLCYNRLLNCDNCLKPCFIKNFNREIKDKFITPDLCSVYNYSSLLKYLNINPKHAVLITNSLKDECLQFNNLGAKTILLLNNKSNFKNYINSPYDIDIVVDDFSKFLYLLNL